MKVIWKETGKEYNAIRQNGDAVTISMWVGGLSDGWWYEHTLDDVDEYTVI